LIRVKKMKGIFNRNSVFIKKIDDKTGSSMPLVLVVMLAVMIAGGAVAYTTVQLFTIVRKEEHNQMTYIAAESAIERSIANLDQYLTKEDFATDRGIVFSNEEQFINDIVDKLNKGDSEIKTGFSIPVYADSSMNNAEVKMSFSWGGEKERLGNKLKFNLEITATAEMENGIFKSYGKKAVAVKEYEVWIYKPFFLNGAVYTLGDLVAKGSGTSEIEGDVYVFGTGLDKPNRMDQYYMGGICATDSAILHIRNGSAYTRNLLRVGTIDETSRSECAIVVDRDVVAEGIQAFGYNDSIVIIRDAYTFDDIEMNGANSYIAVNGNFFGLNIGDGLFHDTSSAVINTSPRYAGTTVNEFTQSRIVINGYTFVNGSAFLMDVGESRAEHQLEDVALAWKNDRPVYMTRSYSNTREYIDDLKNNGGNGFSVILGDVGWSGNANLGSDWTTWTNWISEIRRRASGRTNALTSIPDKIKGLCFNAMAANNKVYFAGESDFEIPASIECKIGNDVDGLDPRLLENYIKSTWIENTDKNSGIPKGLNVMMSFLKSHVQVFAIKDYPGSQDGTVSYRFSLGMHNPDNLESTTEFLRIRDELDNIDTGIWDCVIKFGEGGRSDPVDLVQFLEDNYTSPTDYFLIINLNPDRELVINRNTVNGIIFTMGKITVQNGATVNGAIIAAGKGYDPVNRVAGSAAEFDNSGDPRLPRIAGSTNIDNFRNWDYAALILEGGNVFFPGRENLLDSFTEEKDGVQFSEILKEIF